MKSSTIPGSASNQRGLVLITSLVFLVVITLLAVTAMNRSTLQERMASNMRDQSRGRQAADVALREVERRLTDPVFNSYQIAGTPIALNEEYSKDKPDGNKLTLSSIGLFKNSEGETSDDNSAYLDPANWTSATDYSVLEYVVDKDDEDSPSLGHPPEVQYVVQPAAFSGRDLNPDTAAIADGTMYYRITARSSQKERAAVVTQSTYTKHY